MRLKKSILAMVLSCLTILNVFTIPVMAAEPAASETEEIMVASVPSDAKYAGTIYRNGGKQQMNNWIHDLVSTISTRGWNNVPDMTLSIIYGKSSLKDKIGRASCRERVYVLV